MDSRRFFLQKYVERLTEEYFCCPETAVNENFLLGYSMSFELGSQVL